MHNPATVKAVFLPGSLYVKGFRVLCVHELVRLQKWQSGDAAKKNTPASLFDKLKARFAAFHVKQDLVPFQKSKAGPARGRLPDHSRHFAHLWGG